MTTPAFKALQSLLAKRGRAWRAYSVASRTIGARLDPATGGNACLIGNWGNEEARAFLRRADARWRRYSDAVEARYLDLARAHVRHGGGNPIF